MKALCRWMTGTHLFVGIGALFGGAAAVISPSKPLGMSTDLLEIGPFDNFLIPGLFLLIILGAGNLLAAFGVVSKVRCHPLSSGAMGAVLIMWIIIQCYILQAVAVLHVIFFIIGAAQGLMACALLYRQNPPRFSRSK